MKKSVLAILLGITAIVAIVFAILYFQESSKNSLLGGGDHSLLQDSLRNVTTELETFTKAPLFTKGEVSTKYLTSPIDWQTQAVPFLAHFNSSLNTGYQDPVAAPPGHKGIFPYGVFVDGNIIRGEFTNATANIDGFRIYPIRYTVSGILHDGSTYTKEDVNFMLVFTHPGTGAQAGKHIDDTSLGYDFNQPCPYPPCQ